MCDLHEDLERRMPKAQRVSLVHNDLKLDNCMFDPANPDQVIAIFDWDMTTLGDPLVDLGTMLNYWPDPSDDETNRGHAHPGMEKMGLPTRAEVLDKYGDVSGLDVSQAHWYAAFAHWKTGVEMEALCGVSTGLLCAWDMVKSLEKNSEGQYPSTNIRDIRVLEKRKGEAQD